MVELQEAFIFSTPVTYKGVGLGFVSLKQLPESGIYQRRAGAHLAMGDYFFGHHDLEDQPSYVWGEVVTLNSVRLNEEKATRFSFKNDPIFFNTPEELTTWRRAHIRNLQR